MREIIEAFEKAYPELFWHVAKGRLSAAEPLYGAIITLQSGQEIGAGESNVSADAAFAAALSNSGLSLPNPVGITRADVLRALNILTTANGADLDEWTDGYLPCDDMLEALKAARSTPTQSEETP